eukprot:CAMPEP_0201281832 /NCGR_PEP_ID=MMETSP1317-20130820/4168_1 /ASSEMBLY_ACC=CAM_ASM_000770 /TAXON_ID=187299 /ORGANISM="Undescribed Undescribed, Strain Undescribed" /LENGTH=97 /DNA_ID=CAMNT_0047592849 /DNA_START=235 /DNA_END=528 /DNA_ORIENTATION=+
MMRNKMPCSAMMKTSQVKSELSPKVSSVKRTTPILVITVTIVIKNMMNSQMPISAAPYGKGLYSKVDILYESTFNSTSTEITANIGANGNTAQNNVI